MRELTYFPLLEAYPKTSGYGTRVDPITGAQSSFHRGVDYGAPYGAPVIAPYEGQVTSGYESGAGNWCWVVNGSDMFKSFHHQEAEIGSGWVAAGTTIAWIGSTGSSTGAHAHLELWENGANIDPTGYLDRAPLKGGESSGEEMTDAEWNKMASLLNTMLVGKLAAHTTPNVLMGDDQGQFVVVVVDGQPHRRIMRSGAEVSLSQKTGLLAPHKPVPPPATSPTVFNVNELSQEERDILYSWPVL
jgi:hypothetical protein